MQTDIRTADLQLREDTWIASVDAELQTSLKNISYETKYNEDTRRDYVNGVNIDDFSPISGYGMAIDLGAVYKLNDDWEFSASLLDLGCISWDNNHVASTNGLQQVVTDDYSFNVDNNDTWDKFKDNLTMLYQLEDLGDTGSRLSGIGATMNLAAQYTLPVYRRAKFGFLSTTRFNGPFTWTDFRLSANIEPISFISAGVNVGMGNIRTLIRLHRQPQSPGLQPLRSLRPHPRQTCQARRPPQLQPQPQSRPQLPLLIHREDTKGQKPYKKQKLLI